MIIKNDNMNNELELMPVNTGVILKFYDENPYKAQELKSKQGLIINATGDSRYKSNETGEMEESIQIIACAKVIAVGPKCENVKVGEDVYCARSLAIPVPFQKLGYYILSEQNINCRIVSNMYVSGIDPM